MGGRQYYRGRRSGAGGHHKRREASASVSGNEQVAVKVLSPKIVDSSGDLGTGDSLTLLALLLGVILVIIVPPLLLKVLLLAAVCAGFIWLVRKSRWTHAWSPRKQYLSAAGVIVLFVGIASRQYVAQWRSEHPVNVRAAISTLPSTTPTTQPASLPQPQTSRAPRPQALPRAATNTSNSKPSTPAKLDKKGKTTRGDTWKFVNNTVVGGAIPIPPGTNAEIRLNNFYNTNSAFQNAGKADRVFLEENTIHPSRGGSATVIQNLPTGQLSNVIERKNVVFGESWWTQFADSIVANSGSRDKIQELVNNLQQQCELAWRNYSNEAKQRNRTELTAIIQEITSHVNDEVGISGDLHKVPSFAVQP